MTTKPISERAYKILTAKTHNAENAACCSDPGTEAGEKRERVARALRTKLDMYSVRCECVAHDPEVGGMIDNCMSCAPRWGFIQNPALKRI